MTTPIPIARYRRVSTQAQEDGTSLEGQQAACAAYEAANGLVCVADFQDVMSGATADRPGLEALLQAAQRGQIRAVVVYHLDRLSRDVTDALLLLRKLHDLGLRVHDTTSGVLPVEIDIVTLVKMWFAAEERRTLRRRMTKGLRDKARVHGLHTAQGADARFGYRYVLNERNQRVLAINPDEADVVRRIYDMYLNEGLDTRRIALRLTAEGVLTPLQRGRHVAVSAARRRADPRMWQISTVARILSDTMYYGEKIHFSDHCEYGHSANGKKSRKVIAKRPPEEWVIVQVPAIVARETYDAARLRSERNRNACKRNEKHFYLLSHRIRCHCGYAMSAVTKTAQTGQYMCGGRKPLVAAPCTQPRIIRHIVDEAVWAWLRGALTPDKIADCLAQEAATRDERIATIQKRHDTVRAQISEIEQRDERIKIAYVSGAFSLDEMTRHRTGIDAALRALRADLAEIDATIMRERHGYEDDQQIISYAHGLHGALDVLSDAERREIVELLDVRVVLGHDVKTAARWADVTARLVADGRVELPAARGGGGPIASKEQSSTPFTRS